MAKTIQIRNVPEEVHRQLRVRAAQEGRSLSDYLLHELLDFAARPTLRDVIDRASERDGGVPVDEIVEAVQSGRDRAES